VNEILHWLEAILTHQEKLSLPMQARALRHIGNLILYRTTNSGQARPFFEQRLAIARRIGDRRLIFNALLEMAVVACEQGDYETSNLLSEEILPYIERGEEADNL